MNWNLEREADVLEKQLANGCSNGKSTQECHLLGRFMEMVKKDYSRAATLYKSNCEDGKHGDSCYHLGQLYHSGNDGQTAPDHAKAFEYNKKGCELGHAESCFGAGMANLSDKPEDGCIRQDIPSAVYYLKRACHLESGFSCYMLAGVYITGAPGAVDRDLSAAYKYDFEACQLDFPLACANLNGQLGAVKMNPKATAAPSSGALWRAAHFKSQYGMGSSRTL